MLTKPRFSDKIHHVPNGTYALVAQLDRVTDYESVGRGFESLPSHQEKPVHIVYWFFFFVCAMEGARTGRRRIAPQAISPVGCCLARWFQRVGMSTVEAVNRKISWLFCFCGRGCTHLHTFCTLYKKAMNSLHRLHSVYFAAQKLSLSGRGPDKLGGIGNKGYHGLRRASRWFCKFYCGKAVIVGLIS